MGYGVPSSLWDTEAFQICGVRRCFDFVGYRRSSRMQSDFSTDHSGYLAFLAEEGKKLKILFAIQTRLLWSSEQNVPCHSFSCEDTTFACG